MSECNRAKNRSSQAGTQRERLWSIIPVTRPVSVRERPRGEADWVDGVLEPPPLKAQNVELYVQGAGVHVATHCASPCAKPSTPARPGFAFRLSCRRPGKVPSGAKAGSQSGRILGPSLEDMTRYGQGANVKALSIGDGAWVKHGEKKKRSIDKKKRKKQPAFMVVIILNVSDQASRPQYDARGTQAWPMRYPWDQATASANLDSTVCGPHMPLYHSARVKFPPCNSGIASVTHSISPLYRASATATPPRTLRKLAPTREPAPVVATDTLLLGRL